jgi:hypothetical protein
LVHIYETRLLSFCQRLLSVSLTSVISLANFSSRFPSVSPSNNLHLPAAIWIVRWQMPLMSDNSANPFLRVLLCAFVEQQGLLEAEDSRCYWGFYTIFFQSLSEVGESGFSGVFSQSNLEMSLEQCDWLQRRYACTLLIGPQLHVDWLAQHGRGPPPVFLACSWSRLSA